MRSLRWSLFALIVLQIPFGYQLYQSYCLHHFLSVSMVPDARVETPFADWRGAVHVHSAAGGHSLGTYHEILDAVRECGYDFVFITEHPRPPLFVAIEDPGIVTAYGWEKEILGGRRIITDESGELKILTHFSEDEIPEGYDGVEIVNLHEAGQASDTWLNRLSFLYHQLAYSDLFYFHLWNVDRHRMKLWDRALMLRPPVIGSAGNDAHQNVGLILQTANGRKLFTLLVDPYLSSLRFVATHLQVEKEVKLNPGKLIQHLKSGSFYLALEQVCDPTGFSFHAFVQGRSYPMGSEVPAGSDLVFQAPLAARFRLYRSGEVFKELEGNRFVLEEAEQGVYRVEVYPLNPPGLLQGKPWILSNPIYVQ